MSAFRQNGSTETCPRCNRRISERSARAFGPCPWCRADGHAVTPVELRPNPGETKCLISETAAEQHIDRDGRRHVSVTVHQDGDPCGMIEHGNAVQTSVETLLQVAQDRPIALDPCVSCGEGLL